MMKIALAALMGLTLAACASPQAVGGSAPTPQASDKDRFVAAIENSGCVINASTIGSIMSQASINQDQVAALSFELENEGALSPDGTDTIRLSSLNCI